MFDDTMTHLEEVLTRFNAREADAESILGEFRKIAETVFFGGYFLVNGETRIYPVDIEFYMYGEKKKEEPWMQDKKMIHRKTGNEVVSYFPNTGSFFPHTFGIDVTFENLVQEYRASFLIRSYRKNDEAVETHPTYLWDDLFGEAAFSGSGLSVIWVDDESGEPKEVCNCTRLNLNEKKGKPDTKPWRYYMKSVEKYLVFK